MGISLSVDSAINFDNYCDKTRMSRSKAVADRIEKFCSNNKERKDNKQMKSRKNNQRKAFSITISTTLLAYVDKAAKADNRSRSNYIEAVLAKLARSRKENEQ